MTIETLPLLVKSGLTKSELRKLIKGRLLLRTENNHQLVLKDTFSKESVEVRCAFILPNKNDTSIVAQVLEEELGANDEKLEAALKSKKSADLIKDISTRRGLKFRHVIY